MNNTRQNGFGIVAIIATVAVIAVSAIVLWRVLEANTNSGQNSQSTSNTANNQEPAPEPVDPNAGYVVIKEWGVRFKPVDGLMGVQYFQPTNLSADEITFTTAELSNISQFCRRETGSIIVGLLTRSTIQRERAGGVVAKVGDYYYQYAGPQAACTESSEHDTIENKTTIAISKSLRTLEAAK